MLTNLNHSENVESAQNFNFGNGKMARMYLDDWTTGLPTWDYSIYRDGLLQMQPKEFIYVSVLIK